MKYHRLLTTGILLGLASCAQTGPNPATTAAVDAANVGPNTLNVADAAIAGGDPAMALSVAQSVLQADPNDADALIHEGDAYYALQRCPDSIAAYTLALKADPRSSMAETGLGRCYIKTDPKSAEIALLQAIQDDPGNAAALNDLGIARDLQGNFAGAISPYQQALLAQPGLSAVEVNLGLSLALSGNGAAALQYLGPLAMGPDATPKIRQNYAAALVASGRDADARQVLSVDLPPDQVNSAMAGFIALIAASQPAASAGIAPVAAQTASGAPTMPVTVAPLAHTPAVTAATAPRHVAAREHVELRVGSLKSAAEAKSAWNRMVHSMPALLAARRTQIHIVEVDGKKVYRLRIGSFASAAEAEKFCGQLSASGRSCSVL